MKKFCLVFTFSLFIFGNVVFAQSSRSKPAVTETPKANQRPTPTPTPVPTTTPKIQTTSAIVEKSGEVKIDVPDDGEVIKVDTSLVNVPFKVLDRSGRFVKGLQQTDFEVYEEGKKQEIALFSTEQQKFTVVLLIDVSLSSKFKINEIQNAAIAFTNQLRKDDRVMVIAFNEVVAVLCEPTSDREVMSNAIKQTEFGGGTSLYEAVDFTLKERLAKIPGRKAIVLFTDGVDTTSRKVNFQESLNYSEESEALIYPIQYDTYADVQNSVNNGSVIPLPGQTPSTTPQIPKTAGRLPQISLPIPDRNSQSNRYPNPNNPNNRTQNDPNSPFPNSQNTPDDNSPIITSSGASREEYARADRYLEQLSLRTGGRVFHAENYFSLGTAFTQIANELREQYSLGYYPTELGKEGSKRRIKVKVLQSKLAIRARDSYVVGKDKKLKANKWRFR